MTKYTTRKPKQRLEWAHDDEGEVYLQANVSLQELEDTFTGLLDSNGDEIYREAPPIGFDLERFK